MTRASARRTTHRAVGMGDMDVELVMTVFAFSRARTRHQLRLRARRLELENFAHDASSILRGSARQCAKPNTGEANEAFRICLIVAARLLEARNFLIVER